MLVQMKSMSDEIGVKQGGMVGHRPSPLNTLQQAATREGTLYHSPLSDTRPDEILDLDHP